MATPVGRFYAALRKEIGDRFAKTTQHAKAGLHEKSHEEALKVVGEAFLGAKTVKEAAANVLNCLSSKKTDHNSPQCSPYLVAMSALLTVSEKFLPDYLATLIAEAAPPAAAPKSAVAAAAPDLAPFPSPLLRNVNAELKEALTKRFGEKRLRSLKTATSSLGEMQDKSLEDFRKKILELFNNTPTPPHLDEDAYRRALKACWDVEAKVWAFNFARLWVAGKSDQILAMEGRICQQTMEDIQSGRFTDPIKQKRMVERAGYLPNPPAISASVDRQPDTQIGAEDSCTFDVAKKLLDQNLNPLVVSFANKGSQQEAICCRSDYSKGWYKVAVGATQFSEFTEKGGILIPGVQIFRENANRGYAYLDQPFSCDVFACTALISDHPDYEKLTKEKMRAMFRVAHKNGNDSLVLGAFGCGTFANDPETIAVWFRGIINEAEFNNVFKNITFGILDRSGRCNLWPFQRTFARPSEPRPPAAVPPPAAAVAAAAPPAAAPPPAAAIAAPPVAKPKPPAAAVAAPPAARKSPCSLKVVSAAAAALACLVAINRTYLWQSL